MLRIRSSSRPFVPFWAPSCALWDHYAQLPGLCLGFESVHPSQTVVVLVVVGRQCPLGARQAVAQISDALGICCPETRNAYEGRMLVESKV